MKKPIFWLMLYAGTDNYAIKPKYSKRLNLTDGQMSQIYKETTSLQNGQRNPASQSYFATKAQTTLTTRDRMDRLGFLVRVFLTIYGLIHGCARVPRKRLSSLKSIIRYGAIAISEVCRIRH